MWIQSLFSMNKAHCIVDSFLKHAMYTSCELVLIGIAAGISLRLAAIISHSVRKTNSRQRILGENKRGTSKYDQLVQQERWEDAEEEYLESFFDISALGGVGSDPYKLWEIRVGDAFSSSSNKQKIVKVFCLAERLLGERSTKSSERKKIRKTMASLLRAHTCFLVPSTHASIDSDSDSKSHYHPDFKRASTVSLWKLLPQWIAVIRLYRNKVCPARLVFDLALLVNSIISRGETSIQEAKRLIYAMLQLHIKVNFPREHIDMWKGVLGDGNDKQAETHVLRMCKDLVAREEWQKALMHYLVYAQMCSSINHRELGLLVRIQLQVTLQNIADTKMVDDVFDLTRVLTSKGFMAESEKEQSITLLYDVLDARIKVLLSPSTIVDLEFFRDVYDMEMDISFLARLEVCSLWQKFLKVCASSNQDPRNDSPMSRLFTQLIERETDRDRAKCMVKFAQKHNPDMSHFNPDVVEGWKSKRYLE